MYSKDVQLISEGELVARLGDKKPRIRDSSDLVARLGQKVPWMFSLFPSMHIILRVYFLNTTQQSCYGSVVLGVQENARRSMLQWLRDKRTTRVSNPTYDMSHEDCNNMQHYSTYFSCDEHITIDQGR